MSDTQKNKKLNVPNLRFPGFEGEWKQYTMGELTELFSRRNKKRINFPMFSVTNSRGFVNQQEQFENREMKGEDIAAYKIISPGEYAYNPARINVGSIARYNGDSDCMISSLYVCFKAKKELVDSQLLLHILKSPKMVYNYGINGEGGVRIYLFYPNFARIRVKLPGLDEQKKIASFLDVLEKRIEIQNKVIEKYESLIKALRHHIFSTIDPEKEVTIADVLSYEQPTKYIVSDTEYSDNKDLTPVLTANKAFVLGYTEEVEGIYDKGPCIILDDFTLDSKIVDFPFKVKSSAIKILSAKTSVRLRYIYEYLKFLDLNTEEHKRHYIAEIEPMTIGLPKNGIIQSIASLFDRIDQRRKGIDRDLQLLKFQKDYLLQALFI